MANYERRRYLLMTDDPVHIGTGGYRLGRVDNSIVREPGTRVPKIPGSSLHGAIRTYTAHLYGTPEAAGQNHRGVAKPEKNPVCYTFGYVQQETGGEGNNDDNATGYSGLVSIFDAQVVLFPVYSMIGPVWVTTHNHLIEAGFTVNDAPASWPITQGLFTWERSDALNLGWLVLDPGLKVAVTAPEKWQGPRWDAIKERIVLVHENLFSQVANSNLEIRTSVSIDPARGAAEDGALFTYEALPRATFLTMDVVLDDYRAHGDPFPATATDVKGNKLPGDTQWHGPLDVVASGLNMLAWLGVGGMGTRGFGRVSTVTEPLAQCFGEEGSA